MTLLGFFGAVFCIGLTLFVFDKALVSPRLRGAFKRVAKKAVNTVGTASDEYEQLIADAKENLKSSKEQIQNALWEKEKLNKKIISAKNLQETVEGTEKHEQVTKQLEILKSAKDRISKVVEDAQEKISRQEEIIQNADSKKAELKVRQELVDLQKSVNATIGSFSVDNSLDDLSVFSTLEEEIEEQEFKLKNQ